MIHPNAIAVTNGKGGVGKTSLTAHIAGLAAISGWRVLAVDLDPQGNLARDLGYMDRSDGGASLFAASFTRADLEPVWDVRRGLDVIPGGPDTRRLSDQLHSESMRSGATALNRLTEVLGPMSAKYDLILFDLPPGEAIVQQAAMRCAHWLILPTVGDSASNDGIGAVYRQYLAAREANPDLDVLGVVVSFVQSGARAMLREITAELEDMLQNRVTVFSPPIRLAKRAALDCRAKGLLAHEYEAAKIEALPWYKAKLLGLPPERFAQNASQLAEDYQVLVKAILGAAIERSESTQKAGIR